MRYAEVERFASRPRRSLIVSDLDVFSKVKTASPHRTASGPESEPFYKISISPSNGKSADSSIERNAWSEFVKTAPRLPRMPCPSSVVMAGTGTAFRSRSGEPRSPAEAGNRLQIGPHSLMARRTFSLLGDTFESAHSRPQPASPTTVVPSDSQAGARRPPRPPREWKADRSPACQESSQEAGTCGVPNPNRRHASARESFWTPRPGSEAGMAIGPPRSILRDCVSAEGPRCHHKRVSFSVGCKHPPPASIADLLSFVRTTSA